MGILDKIKSKKPQQTNAAAADSPENLLVPGIGRIPFPAYRGKEPYIFISYAHRDSDIVFPEIKRFNEQGYRVWYDEGISPGNEWTDEIADALSGCFLFIVMMTPNAVDSHNVQNEINYAIDERKPFVAIHLVETNLRGGLKLQIGTKQAILKYNMTQNEYIYKYTSAFERLGMRCNNAGQAAAPASPVKAPPVDAASAAEREAAQKRVERFEIERIQNSEATLIDFEWAGSAVKVYHGIKKRFTVPDKATGILSFAFKSRDYIERVTLPKTVTRLGADSFFDCPNFELAVIENEAVTFDDPGAFSLCPKLTVQCKKDSVTHQNLQKTFSGTISFFDEPAKGPTAAPSPVQSTPQAPSAAMAADEKKHPWGDYVPMGTAYITLLDGTVHEAIANSLLCCATGIEASAGNYQRLYSGLDNPSSDFAYKLEKMVLFADMQSLFRREDTLIARDFDDEETVIHPVKGMTLRFIDGTDGKKFNSIAIDDLREITFERFITPAFEISSCLLTFDEGALSVPFPYLIFNVDLSSNGIPEMTLTTDLSPVAGFPLTLKRIRKLTIAKLMKAAVMYSPLTEAEIEVELKNGDTNRFTINRRIMILALTGKGVLKSFGLEKLKRIDMP